MFVALKLVNGVTTMVVGPFALLHEAFTYAARVTDYVCPAGETWITLRVEPPNF